MELRTYQQTFVADFEKAVANGNKRVLGVAPEESDALLRELVAHVTRPEFCYLHTWTPGEMILWDNWRFMHSAPGIKPGDRRVIHRTTILGDAKFGRVVT